MQKKHSRFIAVFQKYIHIKNIHYIAIVTCVLNACHLNVEKDTITSVAEVATQNTAVKQHGQLKVMGNKLVDQNDQTVQLRGMSFFWSQWMGQYYTSEVVNWLKEDWQSNIVRAAMGVDETDGYLTNPEIEKQKVFQIIDSAIKEGLYVIVDWHSHHAENYIEEAKIFFKEVAQKYGSYPNIIYEPYNEPINSAWATVLKPYHEEIIATIRAHDPDNLIICGTRFYSQRVDDIIGNKIDDPNVAYTFHYYAASHKQEMRDLVQKAIDNNIPVFVTEFGISEASGDGSIDENEANLWWDFLDKNKISWCNWSIADKDELSAALLPGASTRGKWKDDEISLSGKIIRKELREKNPLY